MPTRRQKFLIPVALLGALALTPALAGCSGNPLQTIVKQATGGQVDVGGTTVPSDFPQSVPLVSGKVLTAIAVGKGAGKSWNISIRYDGTSDPTDTIKGDLKAAGFDLPIDASGSTDGAAIVGADKSYGIVIAVVNDKDGYIVNYTVTPATSE
ncbi:hypothetical protein [Galbitalea soli]|uniref:Lipoprotein n=1 Tax=Galbitalea soli TaxID=1268042 RepID=A0A7C9TPH8_9MICO|nr:hypothetical protein [Galbitalea soli]NEM90618.1 hypothetical protein [Galbitalea soli]NYJ31336.1 hypothetical protein [Galbitalea soli]